MRWVCCVSFAAVVALLVTTLGCGPKASAPPEIPATSIQQFATLDEEKYPEWLHDIEAVLAAKSPGIQLYLVGAPPGQPAIVLAQPADDNNNAPAANWAAPWPAVQTALSEGVKQPTTLTDSYQGAAYSHRLFPLDQSGRLCLMVTNAAPPVGWLNYRTILGVSVLALIAGLAIYRLSS